MAGYILGGALNTVNQNTNPFGHKTVVDFTPKPTTGATATGGASRTAVDTSGTVAGGKVSSGGSFNYGGGGGGSWPSFDYSSPAVPTPTASPGFDFSSLIGGVTDLLSQGQKGDIPESIPLSTQKDTMQLQGLRESAAGWGGNMPGPGGNTVLGNRIPPDESKKLAALQQARIY